MKQMKDMKPTKGLHVLPVLLLLAPLTLTSCRPTPDHSEHAAAKPPAQPPTFTKDIAPILFENCAPCHRTGQPVPFTLLTYDDVKAHVDKVEKATLARHMPPWLPEPGEPTFIGERRLRDDQIDTIQRWVKGGAIEGNSADMPETPTFREGWQIGQPDLVLTLPQPYILKPGKGDVFRNVVLPVTIPSGRFVRAVELLPGAASVVHHAVITIDRTRGSRRRDEADREVGFDGMIAPDAQSPDGHFLGWTPGRGPIVAPETMPWRLERSSDLVVQLHLIPGKTSVSVQPKVGLFFTDTPPSQTPVMIKLGPKTIDIPAGQRDYTVEDRYVLPVDVDVLSVYPHAHYLGKAMSAAAVLPDGTSRTLLRIKQWDFHWQQDYRYVRPVALPRGATITMRYTYDNSDGNEDNPHHPPQPVMYGPASTDEMGDLWLQVLPRSRADADLLVRDFAQREAQANVASAELRVRRAPDVADNQAFLGSSYAEVGRIQEAIPHLERALRLDPRIANAHNYLGGALAVQGRLNEAIGHFRQAAALAPRDERMQMNLGNALNAAGAADDAARAFERALIINPEFAAAHQNLGVYLESRGRMTEAIVHLRRAVELLPESAPAHSDLGAALGETGKIDEALQHIRRALELQPDYAPAKENLQRLLKGKLFQNRNRDLF